MNRGIILTLVGIVLLATGSGGLGYSFARRKYTKTIAYYDRLQDITTESLQTALKSNVDLNSENQRLKLKNKELETRMENYQMITFNKPKTFV